MGNKKAISLYETRLSIKYVVLTIVLYLIAAVLIYVLGTITPYMGKVKISEADAARVSVGALSASDEEVSRADAQKERALLMPTVASDTFYRRLHLIADAQKTVDCMIHFNYDDIGPELYYAALMDAADRGVKVRIILDGKQGVMKGRHEDLQQLLQNHNNICVYYFNPVNIWKPAGLNTLLHDKVTIVDNDKLIIGGANMGMGAYNNNFDMEVMITNSGDGGSAGQATRYYESMLNSGLAKRKTSKKADYSAKQRYLTQFYDKYAEYENEYGDVDYATQGVAVNKITVLSNPVTDGKKSPIILEAIFGLAENSSDTTLVTPYALLEGDKRARLRAAAAKNSRFRLVTNSLYNTRNAAYSCYRHNREEYICDDIELWEYQADDQLHAKIAVFDKRYSIIGSFNLDERSAHIDTETVAIIDSEEFAVGVEEYIDQTFIGNGLRVGADNKYIPSDTVTAGEVPKSKKRLYDFYNALMSLVFYLL